MNHERLVKMNKYRHFFYKGFHIDLKRVGNSTYPLESKSGISVEYSRILSVDVNSRVPISTYTPNFFDLQVFLEQYRNKSSEDIWVDVELSPKKNWYKTFEELQKAIEIILKPLESYLDFVSRINEVREAFKENDINEKAITGKVEDWFYGNFGTRNDCESIKKISETEWQVLFWERGTAKVVLTMFNEKHIYEYILNKYLEVI